MAAELACSVFDSLESKSFNLRLQHSVTENLPGEHCIETDVPFPSGAGAGGGFRCTAKYCANWELSNRIRISVVVTRTHRQIRHKVLAAHIDLPGKTGLPVPREIMASITRSAVPAAGDVEGGRTLSVKREDVERYCLVDGHFTALCTVAVSRSWPPLPLPAAPTLGRDVSAVAPDLADVSFRVEGETFAAHRLVLAARSPVFRAELYGEMAEGKTSTIAIEDMRAPTFRSMLDYMYHGSLPAATPEMDDAAVKVEFQHLYVAADRYGLDTLKEMCEEVLCASVSVSTVLSNLVFAEARTCRKLKPRCLDFLAVGDNFMEMAVTGEYVDIMESPALLAEVQNWFNRPRLS